MTNQRFLRVKGDNTSTQAVKLPFFIELNLETAFLMDDGHKAN